MRITVFNVGRGSAVLVELPNTNESLKLVGVVDCFSGLGFQNPMVQYLDRIHQSSKGAWSIEFFIVTHLHADHFMGLSQFLARYQSKIKRYFDSGIDPRAVMSADYRTTAVNDRKHQRDLMALDRFKAKHSSRIYSLTSPGMPIYTDTDNDLRITSIAPHGSMLFEVKRALAKYTSELKAAVETGAPIPDPDRNYDLNKTSSAVDIQYRGSRVILGGDVLNGTWKVVLREMSPMADVVLMSHHGAKNAYPKSDWNKLYKPNGYSIISGRGKNQPEAGVLRHLRSHVKALWATNLPEKYKRNRTLEYVHTVHLGGRTHASGSIKQGDVICEMTPEIRITGPRIL